MKEKLNNMLAELKALRSEAFANSEEELHKELGRAMSNLIRARDMVK